MSEPDARLTDTLAELAAIVGPARVLTGEASTAAYQQDWRARYQGAALAVLLPGSTQEVAALVAELEAALAAAFERGLIRDAVVATDLAKAERIWALRHHISEANRRAGFTVSNDTSVPVSKLPRFIDRVTARIEQEVLGATVCHAGHIGDGNIHVIAVLSREVYPTPEPCEAAAVQVNLIVHEASVELGGSISAEHGIGRMHVERLERFKPALDLEMMRRVKQAFDPAGLMNPGKILRG